MSKQLKPNKWLELFNIYETLGHKHYDINMVVIIIAPYDALQNFVYLSVVINNLTEEIEGWQLSLRNDAKLMGDIKICIFT